MPVRVMVSARIEEKDKEAFEKAYREVSSAVRGTPGHIRDELLCDVEEPGRYILLAEWESEKVFRAWEDSPTHMEIAAPMFPYWSNGGIERRVYDLRQRLDSVPNAG
ncbi:MULTISPECIES: antibiotic biosynthesis monooxygenase family protein [unclassified Streptomyces]|uniref:antibiotic biosynthesis monooxygenase family protein n=1 Tax=unclassified Streptomyces TaxID=2593676 RepID=UPI0033ADB117